MPRYQLIPALLLLCFTPACADEPSDEFVFDEEETIAQALDYESMVRINDVALPSQHALGDTVNMWVPEEHAELYRAIDPELTESDVEFEPGAVIVKEHLDAGGEPNSVTIMAKAEPGYDAEHADWWWARVDIDGTVRETGQVGFCIGCHDPRAETEYLFGVPSDNRR